MRKYGLITIHNAINHGAVLQALATQAALSKCGCEVSVINYIPSYICEDSKPIRGNKGAAVKILDFLSKRKKKVEKFEDFISNNLNLTKSFFTLDELVCQFDEYDGFIAGSDQIWNPNITGGKIDMAYFCAFAKDGQNIVSYASSLGDRICLDGDAQSLIEKQLKRFSFISVREKSGVDWLKQYLHLTAQQVLDPTLMLTKKEWEGVIHQSSLNINKPYIYVYSVGRTKELIDYAKKIQKILKMDIIVSNSILQYPYRKVRYIKNDSPADFLYLIQNAAVVITSSYHGTIFSANFNIPFLSFPASNVTTNRSSELLDLIGLQKQFVLYDTPFSKDMLDIDWDKANSEIKRLRDESYKYIKMSTGDMDDQF